MADVKDTGMEIEENCEKPPGEDGDAPVGEPCSSDPRTTCKVLFLNRVAQSDCHFKHQQRGDPDLTQSEKLDIATAILDKNPVTFLERFGKALHDEDLVYFEDMRDQYAIKFYLDEIRKNLDDSKNKQKVRNRRYEAMKKLMLETDYFGDEEMKARNPYLYEQLVGQYLSEEEVQKMSDKNETLSEMFMNQLQGMKNNVLYSYFKDREDDQMEESDEDEEDEEDVPESQDVDDKETKNISKAEKQQLRTELVRAMQQRFLNGEDDFDYSQVDNNAEFDAIDIQAQDEQDKYFDDEDEKYFDDDDDDEMNNAQAQNNDNDVSDTEGDYDVYTVEEDIKPGLREPPGSCELEEDLVRKCENKLDLHE